MNADPRVMEYFRRPLTPEESGAAITRIETGFAQHGFGWWALEIPGVAEFAGFVGLSVPSFETHFTPCVETGWRLAFDYWGQGYDTEAATAALAFGFDVVHLREVVAFTATANDRSRRVMEKIGMTRNPADDFDYPGMPEDHPLRRHVLYRVSRES